MSKLFYINKIVRDDEAVLAFDQNEVYLADTSSNLLNRPDFDTTFVEYTASDGGEMIRQRQNTYEQEINGLIVPKTTDYWALRNQLANFFIGNHQFFIVYEKLSGDDHTTGERFKTGWGWLAENLQIPPTPREQYSPWSVTLRIGSPAYEEYMEDDQGKEIYANNVEIGRLSAGTGGQQWDAVGQEWDSVGQVWVQGEGGIQTVTLDTSREVYPVWVVEGEALNPTIRNDATNTQATYHGAISTGQTLTVDFATGEARLDGILVSADLSGSLTLTNGDNQIAFDIDSGDISTSTLMWNNYLG